MSLKRNAIWNLTGLGIPVIFGLIAIPYLYRHLGAEKIGILTLVWALIGYFSLFDFGLGRALTQQVSINRAANQEELIPGLVKMGLIFTTGAGLLGGILLSIVAHPLGFHWLNVSVPMHESAAQSLLIAAIGIPMTTVTTGLRGILEAYEDFQSVNILRMLLGVSNFILPMVSVMLFGPSLQWIICSLVFARLAILIAHFQIVNQKLSINWYRNTHQNNQIRLLFTNGAWITVTNLIGPLMVTADRFIISAVLGAHSVAYYTVPSEMLSRVLIVPLALTSALFPKMAAVMYTNPSAGRDLYTKSLKLITATMMPICIAISVGSYWGLTIWLGNEFAEQSWIIVIYLAFGVLLNSIASVPFSALQAMGRANVTAKLHLVELIFYIPALIFGLQRFGLEGAALVGVVRVGVDLFVLLFLARSTELYKH